MRKYINSKIRFKLKGAIHSEVRTNFKDFAFNAGIPYHIFLRYLEGRLGLEKCVEVDAKVKQAFDLLGKEVPVE